MKVFFFSLVTFDKQQQLPHIIYTTAEYLWGFPLGQRLKDIRVKGAYLKGKNAEARRRQLDTLGFNWKPRRGRPKKDG